MAAERKSNRLKMRFRSLAPIAVIPKFGVASHAENSQGTILASNVVSRDPKLFNLLK